MLLLTREFLTEKKERANNIHSQNCIHKCFQQLHEKVTEKLLENLY